MPRRKDHEKRLFNSISYSDKQADYHLKKYKSSSGNLKKRLQHKTKALYFKRKAIRDTNNLIGNVDRTSDQELVKIDDELYVKDNRQFIVCTSLDQLNDLDLTKYTGLYIDSQCNFHWRK